MSLREEAEELETLELATAALEGRQVSKHYKQQIRLMFAKARGWKEGKSFDMYQLATGAPSRGWRTTDSLPDHADHPYFFKKGRVPVALVAFPYIGWTPEAVEKSMAVIRAEAARNLLVAELLDWPNWYYPKSTVGVIWTPKFAREDVRHVKRKKREIIW